MDHLRGWLDPEGHAPPEPVGARPQSGTPRALRRSLPLVSAAMAFTTLACAGPQEERADPAGRLYVASSFTDEVLILDAETGSLLDRRSLDRRPSETDEPHGVAVAPGGRHWYATVSQGSPTLWKYETAGDRLVGRVDLEIAGAGRVGLDPSGDLAYVPDYWRSGQGRIGQLAVVRLEDLTVLATPSICPAPHDAQVDPSGTVLAVTCVLGDEVVFLDTGTLALRRRSPVGADPGPPGRPRYRPMNLVWSPDGSAVYVTLMDADRVVRIPLDAPVPENERAQEVAVGRQPAQIAWAADRMVVTNRGERSLSILVPTPELSEVRRVPLGDSEHPHGIAAGPGGHTVFATFEGTVEAIGGVVAVDVDSGRVLWRVRLGAVPLGVAWGPGTSGAGGPDGPDGPK